MKNLTLVTLACLVPPFAPSRAPAADGAAAVDKPVLGTPGKVLLEDDFARGEMAPKWRVGLGWFTIKDGVVTATENPADKHGAYAKARFPYRDVVAEFSFKLDGSRSFNFVVDDNTYKGAHAGHICRVMISAAQVQLGDSKFGTMRKDVYAKMKDPATTDQEKKAVRESIKDKVATFKVAIDPAAWHRARVEIVGDEMLVSLNGRPVGYLRSEGLAHPTKNMLGFTVLGKSTLLDDVKVWGATANPDWAARRDAVVAAIRK